MIEAESPFGRLQNVESMTGYDDEETQQWFSLYMSAKKFVESFSWHGSITVAYVGLAVADIVGVFLFDQDSKFKGTDRFIWVIVGDIPSAYLVTDFAPNAAMALNVYIGLMSEWVIAARNGDNVDKLIPVNVPPTMENARELEKRLTFLRDDILAPYKNDLA